MTGDDLFFTLLGLLIWASIAVTGIFALGLLWTFDIHAPAGHSMVILFLSALWMIWFLIGGIIGGLCILEGTIGLKPKP